MPKRLLIIGSQDLASKMGFDRLLPHGPGFRCEYVSWETLAFERLSVTGAELVVALAVEEPRSLARWLRDRPLVSPTLAVLPSAADEDLLRLASETFDDFVLWPGCEGELRQRLARMLGSHNVESVHLRLTREMGMAQLVGQDPAFVATLEAVPLLAASAAPVLLCGETGTGKELFARAIHHLSRREGFPLSPWSAAPSLTTSLRTRSSVMCAARSPMPTPTRRAWQRWRKAALYSWMRLMPSLWPLRPSFCASLRTEPMARWEQTDSLGPTFD